VDVVDIEADRDALFFLGVDLEGRSGRSRELDRKATRFGASGDALTKLRIRLQQHREEAR
jgi:hypothetical protein